jgi:hypothetical protein
MPKFNEPLAQAEYDALIASGMDSGDAHESVELRRLRGEFVPTMSDAERWEWRCRVGFGGDSDDKRRIARLRGVQQMAENDPDKFDQYKRQANAAGVSISGKSYESGLAAYPGDPDAWVKDNSDIKALAKQKGCFTSTDDGLLKISVPLDPTKQTNRQLLARARNTKPVVRKRRNIERQIASK